MQSTLVALVEDKPGVLTRVASLFRRRNYNIESLTVGHTENPGVSRMTIVVDSTRTNVEKVAQNLYKRTYCVTWLSSRCMPRGAERAPRSCSLWTPSARVSWTWGWIR
jgi:acetolactate synthase small subunit